MPLYEYGCACGEVTELRRGFGVTAVPCPCGGQAQRLAVYWQSVVGKAEVPLSDRRYNVSRFQEASQELDYAHTQAEEEQGRELPSPSLYKQAMARVGRK